MSKALNGIYGTFDSEILNEAVVKTCISRNTTIKAFISDVFKIHPYSWYRRVRQFKYGEKSELQRLCRLVNCSFDSLHFQAGKRDVEPFLIGKEKTQMSKYAGEQMTLFGKQCVELASELTVEPTKKSDDDLLNDFIAGVQSGSIEKITFLCKGIKITLEKE